MSIVALTVSSGCHIASAAFKLTLLGNVAPQCCSKTLGEMWKKKKKNLFLTGASTGCCVISWYRRGVQSQGFWVMGFSGAIRDLQELFNHNFIICLLSRGSMPTPSTSVFESLRFGPRVKTSCRDAEQGSVMGMIQIFHDAFGAGYRQRAAS